MTKTTKIDTPLNNKISKPTNIEKLKFALLSNTFKSGLFAPIWMTLQLLRHPIWYLKFVALSILAISTVFIPYLNYIIFMPALYICAQYACNHRLFSFNTNTSTSNEPSQSVNSTNVNEIKSYKNHKNKNKQFSAAPALSKETSLTNPHNSQNINLSVDTNQASAPTNTLADKQKRQHSFFTNIKIDSVPYSFIFIVLIFLGALFFGVGAFNKYIMTFIEQNQAQSTSFDIIALFFISMIFSAFVTIFSFLVIFSVPFFINAPKISDLLIASFEYVSRNFIFLFSSALSLALLFLINIVFIIALFSFGIANTQFETSVKIVTVVSSASMFPLIFYFSIFHAINLHHQFFAPPFSNINLSD